MYIYYSSFLFVCSYFIILACAPFLYKHTLPMTHEKFDVICYLSKSVKIERFEQQNESVASRNC